MNSNIIFRFVNPLTYSMRISETDLMRLCFGKQPHLEKQEYKFSVTNTKTPFLEIYLTSFASACSAEILCYPSNIFKKRARIRGEMVCKSGLSQKYRGMLATLFGVLKDEGLLKLYSGISSMVLRHSIFSGSKMFFYDFLRDYMFNKDGNGKPKLTFARGAFCGFMAGACANVISIPTELLRMQMQIETKRRLIGESPKIHNFFQALTSVYNTVGIVGLWKCTVPSTWRSALVTLGDVSLYDLSKRKLMVILNQPDNLLIQFLGAMLAGFGGAVLRPPVDMVRSRMMNQPRDKAGCGLYYKGTLDCFSKVIREEGFIAMYKGFLPYWLRMGPFAMLFWMTFEQIRRLRGHEAY